MAAKKTAAPDEGLKQLKQDLKQGSPARCYVFYGPEDYLREHYLDQLRKKLLTGGMETFNHHRFSGKELDVQALSEAVDALPMMSERTLVEVWDCDLYKNEQRREALLSLVSDLPEWVCLVFVYDQLEYKSGGNTKLGKLMKKQAVTVHFEPQTQSDLNAWIRRRFKAHGKDIGNDLAEYLCFLCGGLMTGLSGEIDKIAFYASGSSITRADIDACADPVLDARVFEMTDAIAQRDFRRAAKVLSELFLMNTEPIMILAVLGRQVRQLWSARLLMENRQGQSDLAVLWEMKSPWQARRLMDNARRFDLPWCRRAVVLCAQADLDMKSTGLNSRELLTDLLLKLAVKEA